MRHSDICRHIVVQSTVQTYKLESSGGYCTYDGNNALLGHGGASVMLLYKLVLVLELCLP